MEEQRISELTARLKELGDRIEALSKKNRRPTALVDELPPYQPPPDSDFFDSFYLRIWPIFLWAALLALIVYAFRTISTFLTGPPTVGPNTTRQVVRRGKLPDMAATCDVSTVA
jgi:hypothetical protein